MNRSLRERHVEHRPHREYSAIASFDNLQNILKASYYNAHALKQTRAIWKWCTRDGRSASHQTVWRSDCLSSGVWVLNKDTWVLVEVLLVEWKGFSGGNDSLLCSAVARRGKFISRAHFSNVNSAWSQRCGWLEASQESSHGFWPSTTSCLSLWQRNSLKRCWWMCYRFSIIMQTAPSCTLTCVRCWAVDVDHRWVLFSQRMEGRQRSLVHTYVTGIGITKMGLLVQVSLFFCVSGNWRYCDGSTTPGPF